MDYIRTIIQRLLCTLCYSGSISIKKLMKMKKAEITCPNNYVLSIIIKYCFFFSIIQASIIELYSQRSLLIPHYLKLIHRESFVNFSYSLKKLISNASLI